MNLSLKRLMKIVPPPSSPVAPGSSGEWRKVEAELETRLPQDFKDYITTYGAGQWTGFFGVMNPFYQWKHPQAQESWREWMKLRIGHLGTIEAGFEKYHAPFRPFPATEGLLAFGYDDNGGTLCWQVKGDPDNWPIICLDGKTSQEFDCFDLPLTGFLDALIRQRIFPKTFPSDLFPIPQPAFRPYMKE